MIACASRSVNGAHGTVSVDADQRSLLLVVDRGEWKIQALLFAYDGE
jgi:hypothetical protein